MKYPSMFRLNSFFFQNGIQIATAHLKETQQVSTFCSHRGCIRFPGGEANYYLFYQSCLWTIEDLSGRDHWYLAVLAHTHQTFREALPAYLCGFCSIIDVNEKTPLDSLLRSVLDIKAIIKEIKGAGLRCCTKLVLALQEPFKCFTTTKLWLSISERNSFLSLPVTWAPLKRVSGQWPPWPTDCNHWN